MGATGFCVTKILLYGVVNNLWDEFITFKLELLTQGMDFIWVLVILIACRPRKRWPAYFTLSVGEMRSAEGRGNRIVDGDGNAGSLAPLLISLITPDFLFKKAQ